jgi:hypothetical protein
MAATASLEWWEEGTMRNNDITDPSLAAHAVPLEYAGHWIAWNHAGTRIVASGRTVQEAAQAAATAGEDRPVFAKVPKSDTRFVGLRQ